MSLFFMNLYVIILDSSVEEEDTPFENEQENSCSESEDEDSDQSSFDDESDGLEDFGEKDSEVSIYYLVEN